MYIYIYAIGWIVPGNISMSSFLLASLYIWGCCRPKIELVVVPTVVKARWYGVAARSNDSLSDEMSERRLLIDSDRFFMIIGGWLDLV